MAEYIGQLVNQQYGMNGGYAHANVQQQQQQQQHLSTHHSQQHQLQRSSQMATGASMIQQHQMLMQPNQRIQKPDYCGTMQQVHQLGPSQMVQHQGMPMLSSRPLQHQMPSQNQLIQPTCQVLSVQSQQLPQPQMIAPSMNQAHLINSLAKQPQNHQVMVSNNSMAPQQQACQQGSTQQQTVVGHSPGFLHPSQAQLHNSALSYQQSSPNRPAVPPYATPSPESMSNAPIYRAPVQRSPMDTRNVGQSSAIRQALGHTTTMTSTSSTPLLCADSKMFQANIRLIDKDTLEALVKSVDPLETVEDDVSDALLQLIEEFVDEIVDQTSRVAKHRSSSKLEPKDVRYVLTKRYKMFLPTQIETDIQEKDFNCSKLPVVEAHRQRMNLIKKLLQKP